jgi:signal transduction histidine kinase
MNGKSTSRELKSTSYELFILLISILSLFNLLFLLIPGFDQTTKDVVRIMDGFITVLFMADFLYRFFTAESKRDYFFKNWGWADLLASLPVQQLKIFRVFRIIKVFRLLREFGLRNMLAEIRDNRAGSALYLTVFMVLLVLEFGGVAIVSIESSSPDANITNASDARRRSEQLLAELQEAHQQLQTYAGQAEELAIANERTRLARDLHDSVAQTLYGLTLQAEAASRKMAAGQDEAVQAHLQAIREDARQTLQETRLLIFELRPPILEEAGLAAAIKARIDTVEARGGTAVHLDL